MCSQDSVARSREILVDGPGVQTQTPDRAVESIAPACKSRRRWSGFPLALASAQKLRSDSKIGEAEQQRDRG
eukprot:8842787-Pyramimonas_sp.AAC.1